VQSPDQLAVLPGNVYTQSPDSGDIKIGFPESGQFGSVVSGALEGSNVDIAQELTNMIESQRNYTANSKIFQTGSDLLDVLVNLKR
jgi:flagellar hook protein FlgE